MKEKLNRELNALMTFVRKAVSLSVVDMGAVEMNVCLEELSQERYTDTAYMVVSAGIMLCGLYDCG